jgi:uncharacterized protein YbcV (DUF1398 family)
MSVLIDKLQQAQQRAMAARPQVGGFPYLAEVLRQAGVRKNVWALPSCQSLYVMAEGAVVMQMPPLATGMMEVPRFDREALVRALRVDQAGKSTFPEFLRASWEAGVVGYEVDFAARTVRYSGANGEEYVEAYPAVEV